MEAKKKKVVRRKLKEVEICIEPQTSADEAREKIRSCIQDFLGVLLKFPEKNRVEFSQGDRTTVYEIDLDQADFGRLMGAKGKHIMALRTLVMAASGSYNFRSIVQIKDENRFF